ncbi:FAD-dependent monooxygenase [Streptomyces sp. N2-109]|uniref:FAD-dependent monooxygenase n=1 Tax=Streptomyces gossypii TaxID=2883101 RepID=A0ABT2JVZ3_9ACTN|nr:FAD-dependent monooxygenase [Streptomyces gossypii]MCT2592065.1 FAD-dependent monooxygenase [Streptomyces gossypii]
MAKSAIIVGGGIGGLAAALHLRARDWDVEVRERAAGLPRTGTALGIWPSALHALDSIGVGATVRTLGRAQTGGGFVRADGSRIADVDVDAMERHHGDPMYLISRAPLLHALAAPLEQDGAIRFGEQVTDVRELTGYDVVIAADGINSQARTTLFGSEYGTRYTGVTSWRGIVDGDTSRVVETWGTAARFGVTPHTAGRTNWFACVRAPEHAPAPGGDLATLRTRFGHWHPGVRRVLDELDNEGGAGVLRHDLHDLARPLPSYVSGHTALIGDAAHAMTPALGRGACEALIDGVTLARALTTHDAVGDALTAYDAQRRRTTQWMARASRLLNQLVHTPGAAPLRNAAMRVALAVSRPPG